MQDSLGDRMKHDYEDRCRYHLPRRTYTIARIDGKAFHTFTKHCEKPFDLALMLAMNATTERVCERVQGCQFAYIQSDEVSFLLTDFDKATTDAYFDGNLQKITSVMSSLFTGYFNFRYNEPPAGEPAAFDCRVFTIPDPIEVENYFYWRWSDWRRNFAQSVGHVYYSHKEMQGWPRQEIQDALYKDYGVDLAKFPEDQKHGRLCVKKEHLYEDGDEAKIKTYWEVIPAVNFKEDRTLLQNLVPRPGY